MAARLSYEIAADDQKFKRIMRGVRGELKALEKQSAATDKAIRASSAKAARTTGGAARAAAGVGPFAEIAKAAKLQQAEEMKRHRAAMRHREREARLSLANIGQIGKVAAREEVRLHQQNIRNAQREARARTAASRSFARGSATTLKNAGRNVLGMGGTALGIAGIGGGLALAGGVGSAIDLEEKLVRLSVNSRGSGQEAVSPDAIRKRVAGASVSSGVSQDALVEGLTAAVAKTGDLGGALASLDTIATASMATGADATDLYLLQADALSKFGLSAEQAQEALALLNAQGKKGSFELRAMAAQAPRVFAAAGAFGFKGMSGLKDIGGLLQVARDVTGSDEQAAFATEAMLRQMTAKAGKMQSGEAFGGRKVEVFQGGDPTKGARNFSDILGDVLTASRGNQIQLQEVFGEEGIRAVRPFLSKFRSAREAALAKGATEDQASSAGRAAALGGLAQASNVTASWADVKKDAELGGSSTAAEIERLKTSLNEAIADNMLPVVKELVPELQKLAPEFAKLAKGTAELAMWFVQNPWKGIGAVILASVAKDVAMAGIGRALRSGAERLLARGGGGAPSPAGLPPGGPGRGAGRAGRYAAIGMGMAGAGLTSFMLGQDLGQDSAESFNRPELDAASVRTELVRGSMSNDDLIRAQSQLEMQASQMRKNGPGLLDTVFGGVSSLFGGQSAGERHAGALTEVETALKEVSAERAKRAEDQQIQLDTAAFDAAMTETAGRFGDALVAKLDQVATANPRRTNPILDR